jgi:hypothetical protein
MALLKWYRTQDLFERTIKIIGANTEDKNKIKNILIISQFNIFFLLARYTRKLLVIKNNKNSIFIYPFK